MNAKQKVQKALETIKTRSQITAGQVYKGYDYDGTFAGDGWWFKPFNSQPTYLGKSVVEAEKTIDQIAESRKEE